MACSLVDILHVMRDMEKKSNGKLWHENMDQSFIDKMRVEFMKDNKTLMANYGIRTWTSPLLIKRGLST